MGRSDPAVLASGPSPSRGSTQRAAAPTGSFFTCDAGGIPIVVVGRRRSGCRRRRRAEPPRDLQCSYTTGLEVTNAPSSVCLIDVARDAAYTARALAHCQIAFTLVRWSTSRSTRTASRTAVLLQPVRPRPRALDGPVRPERPDSPRAVPLPLAERDDQRHARASEPLDRARRPGRAGVHLAVPRLLRRPGRPRRLARGDARVRRPGRREDTVLVERVQKGVRAGVLEHGRLLDSRSG